MKKLYIIGNGFDLYHGLPTSYKCFNCFMCREHPYEHDQIGSMFDSKDTNMLWCKFEEKLGELNILGLLDSKKLSWLNTERKEDFENSFDELHVYLTGFFQEWVEQITLSCANSKRLELDKTAWYINFNYTQTLESLYKIQEEQICYIHGDTGKNNSRAPIVGHRKTTPALEEKDKEDIINRIDSFQQLPVWANTLEDFEKKTISEIQKLIDGLRKKPDIVLENKDIKTFFGKCASSDEIYVLGHSLADVDLPYFEKIASESPNAKWYVCVVDDKEKTTKFDAISKIVESNKVEFITYDELTMNNDIA